MNNTNGKTIVSIALLLALSAGSVLAAEGQWAATHPRRAEVNSRLDNQRHRINREERKGEITPGQAAALHREDRQVRGEERAMASQNGGHITRQEQATLNQQENAISRQIGK